jgi:PAS domain S-box-containing protein
MLARQEGEFVSHSSAIDMPAAKARTGLADLHASLLDAVEQAVIATDLNGDVIYWNHFSEKLYGWSADEAIGRNILDVTPAVEMREAAAELMEKLGKGESWSGEFTVRHRDGRWFPAYVTDSPLRDAEGNIVGIVGVSMDISSYKEADAHKRLLLDELNHRVKNTLAVVYSIANQTLRTAGDDPARFVKTFLERLQALSNAHDLLMQETWQGAWLSEIVANCLKPYQDAAEHRMDVNGEDVLLPPNKSVALALGLHELATNAAKYGALSNGSGRISIAWRLVEDSPKTLSLTWTESGGPAVVAPSTKGFGSHLLEKGLAQELDGQVTMDYRPEGLRMELTFLADAGNAPHIVPEAPPPPL